MKSAVIGVIGIVVAGAIGTTYVVGSQKHATAEKSATSVSRVSKKSDSSTESSSSSEQSSSTVATSSSKQASASSSSAAAPAAKNMDLSAIQNGDFSSVVGTWKNDQGDSFTIAKDGVAQQVLDGQSSQVKFYTTEASLGADPKGYSASPRLQDGTLEISVGEYPLPDKSDASAMEPIMFELKGATDPVLQTTATDNQIADQGGHPYYRV